MRTGFEQILFFQVLIYNNNNDSDETANIVQNLH